MAPRGFGIAPRLKRPTIKGKAPQKAKRWISPILAVEQAREKKRKERAALAVLAASSAATSNRRSVERLRSAAAAERLSRDREDAESAVRAALQDKEPPLDSERAVPELTREAARLLQAVVWRAEAAGLHDGGPGGNGAASGELSALRERVSRMEAAAEQAEARECAAAAALRGAASTLTAERKSVG